MRVKRDHFLYVAAILAGVAVWISIGSATGRSEAWDSGLYFSVGIPIVCLVSLAIALIEPERAWRWGVLPLVGQFVWMLATQGPGNLLPLGLVMFAVLSLPPVIAAWIGAAIAKKWTGRE
jgi:hypothetical protein